MRNNQNYLYPLGLEYGIPAGNSLEQKQHNYGSLQSKRPILTYTSTGPSSRLPTWGLYPDRSWESRPVVAN